MKLKTMFYGITTALLLSLTSIGSAAIVTVNTNTVLPVNVVLNAASPTLLNFNQFNSSLGTLTQVNFIFNVQNGITINSGGNTGLVNFTASISYKISDGIANNTATVSANSAINVTAFTQYNLNVPFGNIGTPFPLNSAQIAFYSGLSTIDLNFNLTGLSLSTVPTTGITSSQNNFVSLVNTPNPIRIQYVYTPAVAVPEPQTWLLLGSLLICCGTLSFFRMNKAKTQAN